MRNLIVFATLVAAAAATTGAAPAATRSDWTFVGKSDDGASALFVDRLSIHPSGRGGVAADVFSVRAGVDDDGVAATMLALEFDCTRPRYRFAHLTGYSARMRPSYDEAGSDKWHALTGGSRDMAARDYVCGGGKRAADGRSAGATLPFAEGRRRLTAG